jgi:Porin PorA
MRRVVWSVLTGLGVFFIVLAAMLRFFVPGQAVKAPLNDYTKSTLQGTNITYFSAAKIQELTGVTMRATTTIEGDVAAAKAAGESKIAVWKAFTAAEDITNHEPYQYSSSVLAFDRSNGQLVNCCGEFIDANHNLHLSGQGYLLPFNTGKHSYQVFDTTLLKPVTFNFAGTATTDGVATYRYVVHIPFQQIGTQTLPGALLGLSATEVTLPEFYTASKIYWVDPVTGAPLAVSETQRVTLQDNTGATQLVIFDGTLASTPASIASGVATDKSDDTKIALVEVILPILGLLVGIILLVVGLVLSRSRAEYGAAGHEEAVDYESEEAAGLPE